MKAAGRSRGRKLCLAGAALAGVAALFFVFGGACKDSKQAGKEARQEFEKGKEVVKEGLEKGGEVAKKGIEKGGEAAKEGLEKTKEAAKEFSKGWKAGGK